MSAALYIDGQYLANASAHRGQQLGYAKARVDYQTLHAVVQEAIGTVSHTRVFLLSQPHSAHLMEGFSKKLTKLGYDVHIADLRNYPERDAGPSLSANVAAAIMGDLLDKRDLDQVVLASGNGQLATIAKTLTERGIKVHVAAFDGSLSGRLRSLATHVIQLDESVLYDAVLVDSQH